MSKTSIIESKENDAETMFYFNYEKHSEVYTEYIKE